jgi:hypothetical protein
MTDEELIEAQTAAARGAYEGPDLGLSTSDGLGLKCLLRVFR